MPKLYLDAAFEQKNEIAKAVEQELDKVTYLFDSLDTFISIYDLLNTCVYYSFIYIVVFVPPLSCRQCLPMVTR